MADFADFAEADFKGASVFGTEGKDTAVWVGLAAGRVTVAVADTGSAKLETVVS